MKNSICSLLERILCAAFLLLLSSVAGLASAGDLDWSFGNAGKVVSGFSGGGFNRPGGIAVQTDGKILVAGTTFTNTSGYRFSVVRYNADGIIDTTFGTEGRASVSAASVDSVAGIILQPDGKIVVGATNSVNSGGVFSPRFAVIRFDSNGTPDTSFGGNGKLILPAFGTDGNYLRGIALQTDGKIVATGYAGNPSPQQVALARINSDGSLDVSFDGDGIVVTPVGVPNIGDFAEDLVIQPDGKIIVVGNGWETGRDVLLIRYHTDGSLDTSFGGDGIVTTRVFGQASRGYDVELQPDGKIVVAGEVISAFLVLRYNSDGTLDNTFDGDGLNFTSFGGTRAYASSLKIQRNGKILVGGYADGENTTDDFAVARFNRNGSLDTSFDGDGKVKTGFGDPVSIGDKITAMTLQADGKLIAVGEGATFPPSFAIARYITSGVAKADFDLDTKSDVSVFRPDGGNWFALRSADNSFFATAFGLASDKIVPADYDGDGAADVAVFRDGFWYMQLSAQGFQAVRFGQDGDVPVPADYDGDGKTDVAVFRQGIWYILNSSDGGFRGERFGIADDKPVIGDYDGDGKSDLAVFRNGNWYINLSSAGFYALSFGFATDKPVPADYDGDGKTDISVFRDGTWFLMQSFAGFKAVQFGISTDQPVPADYDGDGRTDIAVYREGFWYLLNSASGFGAVSFGSANDKPLPNAYLY